MMQRQSPHGRFLLVSAVLILLLTACQTTAQPAQVTATPTISSNPSTTEPTAEPSHTPTSQPSPTVTTGPEPDGIITLMAVGDIMLGRTIGEMIVTEGIEAPFLFTAETLITADITLGNLECPIANSGTPEEKTYAFRAPLAAADSLAYAGFDVVSLANNHTLDYGPDALAQTLDTLEAQGVQPLGAGMNAEEAYQPIFIEADGLRIAILAFADVSTIDYDYQAWEAGPNKPGIAWAHHDRIEAGVRAAKAEADLVLVMFHNGYEIVQKVSALQQEVAHLAIDAGADLVIGSHPHVLQRIEAYKDGMIFYSMGNFVFDNFLFPPNYTAILNVTLDKDGVVSYEMMDVVVQLNGVPQLMEYDLDD
ncbi:CapA family protein [bacterium]|nr:CapA family protein [bacterium]